MLREVRLSMKELSAGRGALFGAGWRARRVSEPRSESSCNRVRVAAPADHFASRTALTKLKLNSKSPVFILTPTYPFVNPTPHALSGVSSMVVEDQ